MIRHIFVGTANENVTENELDQLIQAWHNFPTQIPQILRLTGGRNISRRDQRFSVVLVADFASMEDYLVYDTHPAHNVVREQITSRLLRPDSRAVMQIEVEE
jgi:hypothetical protein